MKLSLIPKVLGHGLLGSLGVGILLGAPSAQAAGIVNAGTDYLLTPPGGAHYTFPLPGGGTLPVNFGGFPIGTPSPNGPTPPNPDGGFLGLADTVVNRTADVDPMGGPVLNPIKGIVEIGGVTPIEIIGLSLKDDVPITIPSGIGVTPGTYTFFAGLEKYYNNTSGSGTPSTGEMFIRDTGGPGGKTWDSLFTINAISFGLPVGSLLDTTAPDFVRSTLQAIKTPKPPGTDPYDCVAEVSGITYNLVCISFVKPGFEAQDEPWTATPLGHQLLGENLVPPYGPSHFYLADQVRHVAPDAKHIVDPFVPAPAPLPVLGLSAAFASLGRMKKLSSVLKKAQA